MGILQLAVNIMLATNFRGTKENFGQMAPK
jgi:hypothetical protein